MQIVIKSKNLEVTDALQSYIEKKVSRLDRYLPNIDTAQVDLAVQNTKSAQDRQVAQLTLRSGSGAILRTEVRSADLRSSIDTALDKMSRQIRRHKGKHWQSHERIQAQVDESEEEEEEEEEENEGAVVRTKRFLTKPMPVDEAIEQMELLGHDFFLFFNTSTDAFSVLYRRRDGGYGLLLPELE